MPDKKHKPTLEELAAEIKKLKSRVKALEDAKGPITTADGDDEPNPPDPI